MSGDASPFRLIAAGGVRLHAGVSVPGMPGRPFAVVVAPHPRGAQGMAGGNDAPYPHNSLALTHPDGVAWPDHEQEQVAALTVEMGGTVVLLFEGLGDAVTCRTRLLRTVPA